MKMHDLASFAGAAGRSGDHRHVPDCCHVERKTLAASQSRSFYDLDFGRLVVPVADAIDGLGAEKDATPEFASFKLGGSDNGTKYMSIAPAARHRRGADR